jgi:hypothetical protein
MEIVKSNNHHSSIGHDDMTCVTQKEYTELISSVKFGGIELLHLLPCVEFVDINGIQSGSWTSSSSKDKSINVSYIPSSEYQQWSNEGRWNYIDIYSRNKISQNGTHKSGEGLIQWIVMKFQSCSNRCRMLRKTFFKAIVKQSEDIIGKNQYIITEKNGGMEWL